MFERLKSKQKTSKKKTEKRQNASEGVDNSLNLGSYGGQLTPMKNANSSNGFMTLIYSH